MSARTVPALFLVSVLICSIPVSVLAADTPPPPKPAANADTKNKDEPPSIVHNPDGTFTVQKAPASGKSEDSKQKGLVIPPQVVVPTFRVPAKENGN